MGERVKRFEDLIAWQKARELRKGVAAACRTTPFRRDWTLREQMRSAALSVMANIAEGFGRSGSREFHRFLTIALGSSDELRSHMYAALDDEMMLPETFDALREQSEEVGRAVAGLRAAIARTLESPSAT